MYRQYQNPYTLEDRLAKLQADYEANPQNYDEESYYETIAELKDEINFAWQDDEYDSDYCDSDFDY